MTKYLTCIKCDIEQPVTQFIAMKSGEIKRTCKSCKNGHKAVIKKLRSENEYPSEDYCCPICERDIEEIAKYGQMRMKNWVLDHCHETNTFRGWICHHCNTGLGAFADETRRLTNSTRYLDEHRAKIEKAESMYTKKDIPDLMQELHQEQILAKECDQRNYHKLQYSNSSQREVNRLKKLIKLIEAGLDVEDYESGTVLVNGKFVVTLLHDNWRNLYKNRWYRHKADIQHFIDNYVLKEYKQ
jgi:hypothetical protein